MLPAIRAARMAVPKVDTNSSGFKWAVGGTLGVIGYFFIVKPAIDKYKAQNTLRNDQANTIKPAKGKVLKDLTGKPTTGANLSTIAYDLNDALSFPVDQGRVIRVFQSTPWGYVGKLEQTYLDKFGKNLREILPKKLSDVNWIKIKFNFQ